MWLFCFVKEIFVKSISCCDPCNVSDECSLWPTFTFKIYVTTKQKPKHSKNQWEFGWTACLFIVCLAVNAYLGKQLTSIR